MFNIYTLNVKVYILNILNIININIDINVNSVIMMKKTMFRMAFGGFGDSPFLKVLDFFLTFQEFDYSKSQVAEEVKISRVTIEKIWDFLIKSKYIKKTRTIGRATLYQLNKEDTRVKALTEFDMSLSRYYAEKLVVAMKIPA